MGERSRSPPPVSARSRSTSRESRATRATPRSGWSAQDPPAKAVQDLSSGQYQARFDELTGQGYALTIVTASGPAGSERYAAVFERGVHPPWFARHTLRWDPATDPDTVTHEINRAFAEGFIPRCLTVYGDPSDRRFAGVWVKNTDAVLWTWWIAEPEGHRLVSDVFARGGMRPAASRPPRTAPSCQCSAEIGSATGTNGTA
jgi:hypothetical protein